MDFNSLKSWQFENMVFDLLHAAGLKNLVWRTPGPDGGRDIEGTYTAVEFSSFYQSQNWYIECKRYSNSIDWPTIWNKISYADNKEVDFLLFVTNSNPSPPCESEISNWNKRKRRPIVRVWRGYELEAILRNYPQVAVKYGMLGKGIEAQLSLQSLMFEAMKLAQSSYVAYGIGANIGASLEAGAALSELIFARYTQIREYGRILPLAASTEPPAYDWLTWTGAADGWDEVGLRALLSMSKYLTGSKGITVEVSDESIVLSLDGSRFAAAVSSERILGEIANWVDVEVIEFSIKKIAFSRRHSA